MADDHRLSKTTGDSLHAEIEGRLGVLPNFFRLASEAPEVSENLWGFAKFAYLDNPIPTLFKERLFVYLSKPLSASLLIEKVRRLTQEISPDVLRAERASRIGEITNAKHHAERE